MGKTDHLMAVIKIMPCLDMKDGRVVKGVNFVNIRDAGDPVANARFYQEEGADELAMLDIAASVEGRKTRLKWVQDVLNVTSIPLTVGGGISNLEDMAELCNLGVSRFSVNTAAVKTPELIGQASERFGKERVVVAIDGRRNSLMPSGFEVVIKGGMVGTTVDVVEWAKRCEALGAGVLLPTSMDRDGTQKGYDLEFTRKISETVSVPVIASGGAGSLEDLYEGVAKGGATILLVASLFHFRKISIRQAKEYLRAKGLTVEL